MALGSTSPGAKKDHMSIEIMHEDNLAYLIKEKMDCISLSHCVCRVPESLVKEHKEKYFPSAVSIGPFHRGRIKATEDQKWRYFNTLLTRKPNTEAILDSCIKSLRHAEQKTRKFYCETIEMGSDEFIEMILVDGCFIIEIFIEYSIKSMRRRDDPFFGTNDMIFLLRRDLILLENQIPFFILEKLFHLVPIPKQCHLSLIELALCFFKKLIPVDYPQFPPEKHGPEIHHLLDLIRQHYLPTNPQVEPNVGLKHMHMPLHIQATHLHDVGIKLKTSITDQKPPLNINFFNGELEIPSLKIHAYTEILFRNLIAMELCHPECSKYITSYVIVLEKLLQSKRDVRLFREKKILIAGYDREGEIVTLLKKLHVDIDAKDFTYNGLFEKINGYHRRTRQGWCQKLRNIYHRTHFGVAGFSLALLLLVFIFTGGLFSAVNFLLHHFQ